MFEQVLGFLESDAPKRARALTLKQEARAAVAVCLRWGSYLALLVDEARPPAASVGTQGVSRVTDREMARINIEASANLASWLTLAHDEPALYGRLVQAAQKLPLAKGGDLRPMSLTSMAQPKLLDLTKGLAQMAPERAEEARRAPMRCIANAFVNTCWRNGPIEDLHAGEADRIRLGERRFSADETSQLEESTISKMVDAIDAFWLMESDWTSPRFSEYALAFRVMPFVAPAEWTLTESTRAIGLYPDEMP